MSNKPLDLVLPPEEQAELIKELIHGHKKDLMSAMVQEWIYLLESLKPVHVSKAEAEQRMGEYQKRIRFLKENVFVLEKYAKEHDLKI